MKKRLLVLIFGLMLSLSLVACGETAETVAEVVIEPTPEPTVEVVEEEEEVKSIKNAYAAYFDIGVCINPGVVAAKNYYSIVLNDFSSVTCENNMKPENILSLSESKKDLENGGTHLALNFSKAEKELKFASDNGLKMRGHTLIWHEQTPDWIFYEDYDVKGKLASRELMLTRLDNYMHDVFTWADENYPGMFYAWDVVNEAVEDSGKMRDSLWYQTIGEDFVEQAFHYANMYAPDYIKLFYNDFNTYKPGKQRAIIEMLTPIAEAGDIDGMGMQAHLYTGEAPSDFVSKAEKYATELGVCIHVTEIDVPEPSGQSPEGEQGKYYGNLFKALKDAKGKGVPIESVTIWGLADNMSWKKADKPLIFDDNLSPKNAYYEILEAAK